MATAEEGDVEEKEAPQRWLTQYYIYVFEAMVSCLASRRRGSCVVCQKRRRSPRRTESSANAQPRPDTCTSVRSALDALPLAAGTKEARQVAAALTYGIRYPQLRELPY